MFYFAVDTVVVRFGTYYKIMSGQRSRNIIVQRCRNLVQLVRMLWYNVIADVVKRNSYHTKARCDNVYWQRCTNVYWQCCRNGILQRCRNVVVQRCSNVVAQRC